MARATLATAAGSGLVRFGATAGLTITTAYFAVFLALLHAGFHVFAGAAGFCVLLLAFVLATAVHGFFAFGFCVMATALSILHVVHVMATALGFRGRG